MRYVVQIRRSFDLGGQHFVLRVYPEFQPEKRRWESFTSAERLVERMSSLGVPGMNHAARSFSGGGVLGAVWTNVEVPQETLEGFGKGVSYPPVAA
jgi:hypothetical protein